MNSRTPSGNPMNVNCRVAVVAVSSLLVLGGAVVGRTQPDRSPTDEMARFYRVATMIGQKMRPLAGRKQMPLAHHIQILDKGEISYGSCGMNQQVTAYYLEREGVKCRRVGLTGEVNHTVCEAWLEGRWQFFDGLDGVFIPMSLEEMLADEKEWIIRDFGGGRYRKRFKGDYREYIGRCTTKRITYNPRKRNERVVVIR